MSKHAPDAQAARLAALSRWDSEGGAGPDGPQEDMVSGDLPRPTADLTNAELVQMRMRIIALENLVLALVAGASTHQLELAREMSAYIAPRPGSSPHPLTLEAAQLMNQLVARAGHFRAITQP